MAAPKITLVSHCYSWQAFQEENKEREINKCARTRCASLWKVGEVICRTSPELVVRYHAWNVLSMFGLSSRLSSFSYLAKKLLLSEKLQWVAPNLLTYCTTQYIQPGLPTFNSRGSYPSHFVGLTQNLPHKQAIKYFSHYQFETRPLIRVILCGMGGFYLTARKSLQGRQLRI